MFFRKNKEKAKKKEAPSFMELYAGMEENSFFLTDGFLYWKYQGKLTGTTAEADEKMQEAPEYTQTYETSGGTFTTRIRIDMDILDTWIYPEEYRKKSLTQEEIMRFQTGAIAYLKQNGYQAELEYSAQDSFANTERYLGKRR